MGSDVKTDPPVDSGGGAGGGGGAKGPPSYPKSNVISSFAELQSLIPDYESRTLTQLLASPLFTGKNAYQIAPKFWGQLQQTMLAIEKGYGVTPSQLPAGILGSKTALNELGVDGTGAGAGGGGGGGGGAGGPVAQPVFPDYAGAISATWKKYDAEIQANRMPFEDAIAAFNAEMDTITADMNAKIANQNSDIANQNTAVNAAQLTQGRDTQLINIASEQQNAITQANQQRGTAFANANSERTSRSGQLIDLLKRSTPASKGQMSIPLLGSGWGTVVKPDQFFDIQGLNNAIPVPVNQTVNWPTPSPVPTLPTVAPITSGPMPVAPAPPTNYPTTPNLDALLAGLLNPTPSGWY